MHLSSLWRSVVPWHAATAWAICASFVVFVGASISHGLDSGLRGALATFLAWAIVRELAPRRFVPSLLAPFTAVAFAIPAQTDLLACLGVLLLARVASGSVGDPPTRLDGLLLIGLAAWLATRPVGLPVAVVLAAIVLTQAPRVRMRTAGLLALAAALLVGATEGTLVLRPEWGDPPLAAQVLLASAGAAAAWLLVRPLPSRLRTRDDRRRGHLHGTRIRIARLATIAAVAAAMAWTGVDGAFALSSASAALLAAGLGGAGQRGSATAEP